MYTIYIRDLHVSATHGYYSFEKEKSQSFVISIYVVVDDWSHDDKLEETLNYENIRNVAITVLQESPKNLLETLADDIATRVLNNNRTISCKVQLEKSRIFDDCVPGVTLTKAKTQQVLVPQIVSLHH